MKNILVFFVILFFGQLVVGSEADWREHSAITGKGQAVPGDGQFTSQYGLCLAAKHDDEKLFTEILKKQNKTEREMSVEYLSKINACYFDGSGLEKENVLFIDSSVVVQEYMASYRGEILDKRISQNIRNAIEYYNNKEEDEAYKQIIQQYAFAKSIKRTDVEDGIQISPFGYAIRNDYIDAASLLLNITQSRAAQFCQWDDIEQRCSFSHVVLFLQHNLIDFVVNILGQKASSAGKHTDAFFIAYNDIYYRNCVSSRIINYVNREAFDPIILKKVDKKTGNTLLHAAVYFQDEEFVKALLEKGARVEAQNELGDAVLATALKISNGLSNLIVVKGIHEFHIEEAKVAFDKMRRIISLLKDKEDTESNGVDDLSFRERLEIAAKQNDNELFSCVIGSENEHDKQERKKFLKTMGYFDTPKWDNILEFMSFDQADCELQRRDEPDYYPEPVEWNEPDITDQMKAYRGEIEKKDVIEKLREALKNYDGQPGSNRDVIEQYSKVRKLKIGDWDVPSPLDIAITLNNKKSVELLLEKTNGKAVVNLALPTTTSGFGSLAKANEEMVQLLFEHGNFEEEQKSPLLFTALYHANIPLARAIIRAKFDVHSAYNGWVPIFFALSNFQTELALLLIACDGINLNIYSRDQETPLHLAVKNRLDPTVVKALCEKVGIKGIKAKDRNGNTPFHLALIYATDGNQKKKDEYENIKIIIEILRFKMRNQNLTSIANNEGKSIKDLLDLFDKSLPQEEQQNEEESSEQHKKIAPEGVKKMQACLKEGTTGPRGKSFLEKHMKTLLSVFVLAGLGGIVYYLYYQPHAAVV